MQTLQNKISLFVAWLISVSIGYGYSHHWAFLVTLWFGIATYVNLRKLDSKLNPREFKLFYIVIYLYPLLETGVKFMIDGNFIPYSWSFLNRIEHFIWAVSGVILLYPIFKSTLAKLNWIEGFIFMVAVIAIAGNLNEIFEYAMRSYENWSSTKFTGAFYWDTIYDLIINIGGGVVGVGVVRRFRKLEHN